jgi:DNA-binding NtrC family response regulator
METFNHEDKMVAGTTNLVSSNGKGINRVLHVDDDSSVLEVSKQILPMEKNFEVDFAASVDEALKKMELQTYDAIVSGYEMPKKMGWSNLKNH